MTRKEAKNELRKIRQMDSRIRSIEMEIERIEAVATKMTPNYDADKISNSYHNKIEEAIIKKEEYRRRLSKWLIREIDYKSKCLDKIEEIEPSLRQYLMFYYFDGLTIEKISEIIDKSPRWTYELFCAALDEYAKIL